MIRSIRRTAARAGRARPMLFGLFLALVAGCDFDENTGDKVECVRSEDCEDGAICINGTCATDISCIQNDDCPNGRVCINGSCVPTADGSLDPGERDFGTDAPEDEPDVEADVALDLIEDAPDVDQDPLGDVPPDQPLEDAADMDAADGLVDLAPDPDMTEEPDVADATPDAPEDLPPDVLGDPDLFEDFDVGDEDGEIVLNVATFADLPPTAPEGTRAYVTDLDEEFRYHAEIGRWVFLWFYEMSPTIEARIDGDVTPANETPAWQHVLDGAGSIAVVEGEVVFDAAAADADRAFARFTHGGVATTHYFMGEFGVSNVRGTGFLRHAVDVRNSVRAAVVNLENGEDGIRLVNGADASVGTAFGTQTADEPRLVEVYLFAEGRAELYVDHVLLQCANYLDLPLVGTAWYDIGVQQTTGGGTVTARGAVFGRFTGPLVPSGCPAPPE